MQSAQGEVEPRPVLVLRVVDGQPEVELRGKGGTVVALTFSALKRLPESKLESRVTGGKSKVRWEGGCG